jgi:hypothetical protein
MELFTQFVDCVCGLAVSLTTETSNQCDGQSTLIVTNVTDKCVELLFKELTSLFAE